MTAKRKANCIICVSDESYCIIGPFDDQDAMLEAGRRWQLENGGDPRWQTVYLASPHRPPTVYRPELA